MVKQIHIYFLLLAAVLLAGCAAPQQSGDSSSLQAETRQDMFSRQIFAATDMITEGFVDEAKIQLAMLDGKAGNSNQHALLAYAYARLAIAEGNYDSASQLLNDSQTQQHLQQADNNVLLLASLLNADILEQQQAPLSAARLRVYLAPLITDENTYLENHQAIWRLLATVDVNQLALERFASEQDMLQWLQLSQIVQHSNQPLSSQLAAIDQWLENHPRHPAARLLPSGIELIREAAQQQPQKIAVILPLDGKFRSHGVAIRDGFMHAWFQAQQKQEIVFYSFDELPGFIHVYQEAIDDGAQMVIGPLFKDQLQELYQYGDSLPVPTIALNRLDDSEQAYPHNLYEFSLASEDEIRSLIVLAGRQQLHNSIVIHQPDNWAVRAADTFSEQWQAQQGNVLASVSFNNTREQSALVQKVLNIDNSRQRSRELQQLTGLTLEQEPRRRQDIDMIVLITRPEAAASIRPLLSFHYASDIPVYATSSVYRGYANPSFDNDLNGIYFTDAPLVISGSASISAQYRQSPLIRMYAMGSDAFQLSGRISLMAQLPDMKLYGASGQLSVSSNNIDRQTAYGRFVRGRVQAVSLPEEPVIAPQHAEQTDRPANR